MTTLADFLLARIAEDQAAGEQAAIWPTQNGLAWVGPTPKTATLLAISGPRVLAECDAKRKLIESPYNFDSVLRYLALPYADHNEYRPEWKPT